MTQIDGQIHSTQNHVTDYIQEVDNTGHDMSRSCDEKTGDKLARSVVLNGTLRSIRPKDNKMTYPAQHVIRDQVHFARRPWIVGLGNPVVSFYGCRSDSWRRGLTERSFPAHLHSSLLEGEAGHGIYNTRRCSCVTIMFNTVYMETNTPRDYQSRHQNDFFQTLLGALAFNKPNLSEHNLCSLSYIFIIYYYYFPTPKKT